MKKSFLLTVLGLSLSLSIYAKEKVYKTCIDTGLNVFTIFICDTKYDNGDDGIKKCPTVAGITPKYLTLKKTVPHYMYAKTLCGFTFKYKYFGTIKSTFLQSDPYTTIETIHDWTECSLPSFKKHTGREAWTACPGSGVL